MTDFNVNVMGFLNSHSIPCLLCGAQLNQRTDKNGKPYFVCDPCGVQLFIRRKAGIERLKTLCRNLNEKTNYQENPQKLLEIQALVAELTGIQAGIAKLDSWVSFFFPDETLVRAKNGLQNRMDTVLAEIEAIGNAKHSGIEREEPVLKR